MSGLGVSALEGAVEDIGEEVGAGDVGDVGGRCREVCCSPGSKPGEVFRWGAGRVLVVELEEMVLHIEKDKSIESRSN
jgi:hypothetical protein